MKTPSLDRRMALGARSLRTQDYFDPANPADRLQVPVLLSAEAPGCSLPAGDDTVCFRPCAWNQIDRGVSLFAAYLIGRFLQDVLGVDGPGRLKARDREVEC